MPVTVVEQIALVLLTRLEAMISDDYETLVTEVIRPTRAGNFTPKDGQIVLVQGESVVVPELSYPGNPPSVARRQTFNIRCHVLNDEESEIALDAINNTFAADVIKCVTSTSSTWHTFDNLAIDATIGDLEFVSGDGGPDGVSVPIAIVYRTDEDDPYAVRA